MRTRFADGDAKKEADRATYYLNWVDIDSAFAHARSDQRSVLFLRPKPLLLTAENLRKREKRHLSMIRKFEESRAQAL